MAPSSYLTSPSFCLVVEVVQIMAGQLPVTRSRVPAGQRSSKDRICGGQVEGCGPLQHLAGGQGLLRTIHVWWPTFA